MKQPIRTVALALALGAAGWGMPVSDTARNPAVTLKVDNLELLRIVERLAAASGVPLTLHGVGQPEARTGSFDWQRVGLGGAMRDVCRRFGLTAQERSDGGYVFRPGPGPETPGA